MSHKSVHIDINPSADDAYDFNTDFKWEPSLNQRELLKARCWSTVLDDQQTTITVDETASAGHHRTVLVKDSSHLWKLRVTWFLYRCHFCKENCIFNVQLCWAFVPCAKYRSGFKCHIHLQCLFISVEALKLNLNHFWPFTLDTHLFFFFFKRHMKHATLNARFSPN